MQRDSLYTVDITGQDGATGPHAGRLGLLIQEMFQLKLQCRYRQDVRPSSVSVALRAFSAGDGRHERLPMNCSSNQPAAKPTDS